MASTVKVLVATAEREVYRGEAEMLVAPGAAGDLGILPSHSPLLCALTVGELRITVGPEALYSAAESAARPEPHHSAQYR